jgi:hypothetical protein
MNRFVETRLVPVMQRLNVPPPTVDVYPLHNMNVYPTADKYRLSPR